MSDEVFSGGATTSQHVDAEDDDHFENTTFKLKRTRSLGLLDEFIPEKVKDQALEEGKSPTNTGGRTRTSSNDNSDVNNHNHNSNQSTSVSSSPSPIASPTATSALNLQSPELLPYDDTDVAAEPSRHVDYLSHQWDVSDISKSWRYVVSNKHDVANAARLENASWRTWAQRRSNLKTISPEEVNWAKETDVTWLYGPILKNKGASSNGDNHANDENEDDVNHEPTATSAVAGDISIPKKSKNKNAPKPILKKRTIEESIISHTNLLKLELASSIHQKKREQQLKQQQELQKQNQGTDEYFDYNALSNKLNSQYANNQATENTNVAKFQNLLNSNSSSSATVQQDIKPETSALNNDGAGATAAGGEDDHNKERHIHFNDEVQQCVAWDSFSDDNDEEDISDYDDTDDVYDDYDDQVNNNLIRSHLYEGDLENGENDDDSDDDDNDDDDEGGFFLKVRSNSNPSLKMVPSQGSSPSIKGRDQTGMQSLPSLKRCRSIKLLPPTTLNYGSDEDSSDEEYPYTSSLSHNVGNDISRGYDYYYDYNTVYPSDPYQFQGYQTPDVIDVPENLDMGSNVNYDLIDENNNDMTVGTTEHNEYGGQNEHSDNSRQSGGVSPTSHSSPTSPLSGPAAPAAHATPASPSALPTTTSPFHNQPHSQAKHMPFQLSDSESDSEEEEEEGLSIGTRRSSQALAESIFHGHNPLTESKN
ncbi:REG1 [Candida margitis]|uniref:REG1 n=1 Tax=Candida margitis TaxID=1775924 RepID=UPI002226D6DD|nr:REG1 [Candida margitis]KAI5953834.1 REG1 [Candida margitis]